MRAQIDENLPYCRAFREDPAKHAHFGRILPGRPAQNESILPDARIPGESYQGGQRRTSRSCQACASRVNPAAADTRTHAESSTSKLDGRKMRQVQNRYAAAAARPPLAFVAQQLQHWKGPY